MDANEQRARELLAAEYERDEFDIVQARQIREGYVTNTTATALRAIMAALAQQVPADGEWRARDVRCIISSLQSARDRLMPVLAEQYGDAFDGDFDSVLDAINELKRWATRLAATPQARQPAQGHCAGHPHFEYDCIDCMDALQRKRGDKAPQPVVDGVDAEMAQQAADEVNPAWWRGSDAAVSILCQKVNAILDGKDDGRGVANEPWESTRRRLLASQPQQGAVAWVDPRDWELFVNIDQDRPHAARKVMLARRQTKLRTLPLYTTIGQQAVDDAARLDAIAREYWKLDPFDMPTGAGDADVGWRVVNYHGDAPRERVVAEVYEDDPRKAIDAALAAHGKGDPT